MGSKISSEAHKQYQMVLVACPQHLMSELYCLNTEVSVAVKLVGNGNTNLSQLIFLIVVKQLKMCPIMILFLKAYIFLASSFFQNIAYVN